MRIDDLVHKLSAPDGHFPRAAMRWALDQWDLAGPRLVDLLEGWVDGRDCDAEAERALFYAVHLLGERGETRAYPPLCRLLLDGLSADELFGEALSETTRDILIATFDGDDGPLRQVVEARSADELARVAALEALVYLSATGAIAPAAMRAYLLHLRAEMRPRGRSYLWTAWAAATIDLGLAEFRSEIKKLLRLGYIDRENVGAALFDSPIRLAERDPAGAGAARPFRDAIDTLANWTVPGGELPAGETWPQLSTEESIGAPAGRPLVDPLRHVGRNDPCPCGSGRKYKKCCLR